LCNLWCYLILLLNNNLKNFFRQPIVNFIVNWNGLKSSPKMLASSSRWKSCRERRKKLRRVLLKAKFIIQLLHRAFSLLAEASIVNWRAEKAQTQEAAEKAQNFTMQRSAKKKLKYFNFFGSFLAENIFCDGFIRIYLGKCVPKLFLFFILIKLILINLI